VAKTLTRLESGSGDSFLVRLPVSLSLPKPSRKAQNKEAEGWEYLPKVMGVDIARFGENSSVICIRQGRKVYPLDVLPKQDLMTTAHYVSEKIKSERPSRSSLTARVWGLVLLTVLGNSTSRWWT
jgi:hypothetical protein